MAHLPRLTALVIGLLSLLAAAPAADSARVLGDLTAARDAFYNAEYGEAATLALEERDRRPDALDAYEVRTTALLFEIKRQLGDDRARRRPASDCDGCAPLLGAFHDDLAAGQQRARARLEVDPSDAAALFHLAKLDLNYLWLHNGTLGRRTGWHEYREARRSLDELLGREPTHLRARVALAWIDYIVDTRMPWGTKWLFGGGDRRRAVAAMEAAAAAEGSVHDLAEARFGLWEMLAREKRMDEAAAIARALLLDFPRNAALARFLETHGASVVPKLS